MRGPAFFLVVLSTQFTVAQIKPVATACAIQLMRDAAPEWGQETEGPFPATVEVVGRLEDVPADGIPLKLVETVTIPDAAGFHTEHVGSKPDGEIATKGVSFEDLCVTISHEILETYADRTVNRWARSSNGVLWSLEIGDPVEGDWYEITLEDGTKIRVSNFVTRAWFDYYPAPGAKFDFMGLLTASFTVRAENGGYASVIGADGKGTLIPPDARLAPKKLHAAARTAWRLRDGWMLTMQCSMARSKVELDQVAQLAAKYTQEPARGDWEMQGGAAPTGGNGSGVGGAGA